MEEKQKKNQIERALLVLETLFLDPINGLSNKEIIEKTKLPAVDVCRLLKTLHSSKWAEKNDMERWTPSVKPVGLLKKYNLYLNSTAEKIEIFETRTNAWALR